MNFQVFQESLKASSFLEHLPTTQQMMNITEAK